MSPDRTLYAFMSGAAVFGFLIAGLFFLRFWRRTRDRLFLRFALAFGLLGAAQGALAFSRVPVEERTWIYLVRLLAFLIILVAIFAKNRERVRRG